jgi:hypothetical protein
MMCSIVLFLTGSVKLVSAFGESRMLMMNDPILGITFQSLLMMIGPIEMLGGIAAWCFARDFKGALIVLWFATMFLGYRAIGWTTQSDVSRRAYDICGNLAFLDVRVVSVPLEGGKTRTVRSVVENALSGLAAEQTGLAVNAKHNQTHQTHEQKEHQSVDRELLCAHGSLDAASQTLAQRQDGDAPGHGGVAGGRGRLPMHPWPRASEPTQSPHWLRTKTRLLKR